jgi:hypothetical protein
MAIKNIQLIRYLEEILFLFRLSLLLSKYFNLFSYLYILCINFVGISYILDLFSNFIDGELPNTDDNKLWLRRCIYVAVGAISFYILYKIISNGGGPDIVINSKANTQGPGPIISKHW